MSPVCFDRSEGSITKVQTNNLIVCLAAHQFLIFCVYLNSLGLMCFFQTFMLRNKLQLLSSDDEDEGVGRISQAHTPGNCTH